MPSAPSCSHVRPASVMRLVPRSISASSMSLDQAERRACVEQEDVRPEVRVDVVTEGLEDAQRLFHEVVGTRRDPAGRPGRPSATRTVARGTGASPDLRRGPARRVGPRPASGRGSTGRSLAGSGPWPARTLPAPPRSPRSRISSAWTISETSTNRHSAASIARRTASSPRSRGCDLARPFVERCRVERRTAAAGVGGGRFERRGDALIAALAWRRRGGGLGHRRTWPSGRGPRWASWSSAGLANAVAACARSGCVNRTDHVVQRRRPRP